MRDSARKREREGEKEGEQVYDEERGAHTEEGREKRHRTGERACASARQREKKKNGGGAHARERERKGRREGAHAREREGSRKRAHMVFECVRDDVYV